MADAKRDAPGPAAEGSPSKRARVDASDVYSELKQVEFELGLVEDPSFGLDGLDHITAAEHRPTWNEKFGALIAHPSTPEHHKQIYRHLHRHGSISLFEGETFELGAADSASASASVDGVGAVAGGGGGGGGAESPTGFSLEQLAADIMKVDMPDATRERIGGYLRRGSFVDILTDLRREAESQPGGISPDVHAAISELVAMLERPPSVQEVPGMPESLRRRTQLTEDDVRRLKSDFDSTVAAPVVLPDKPLQNY